MANPPPIKLNDGAHIPQLGLGMWQVPNEQAVSVIHEAISVGFRSIDTAAIYGNEEGVGDAIKSASIPREELFITTKLWNDRHGYDEALRTIDESLNRLKLDYVDLYLIHWPGPKNNQYVETWKAFIKIKDDGRAKSIGVSNFNPPHLQRLLDETGVVPVLNQIELHPELQQTELREFHSQHGIATESWSPLAQGKSLKLELIIQLAEKYNKTPAQIVLRWHIDNGLIVIPKSVTPERIRENFNLFDFNLDNDDLAAISELDSGMRTGGDPEIFF